jgi:hypothetical protein
LEESSNFCYLPEPGIPDGVEGIAKMSRSRDFREQILNSDIIVYDLMTNTFDEVDYVIKTLKTSKLT